MTAGDGQPWSSRSDGVSVRVRVTPKSSKNVVEGLEATAQGPALKVRVRAIPDKGAANAAVAETVAEWLGVPKSTVTVMSGTTARVKVLAIAGDTGTLGAALTRRIRDFD
jgi:uncharacterized protein (TIGR00251 family)